MTYQSALQALANPTRRAVFEQLRHRPKAVSELAASMPVSRPAVSQHLKVLKDAGLVRERKSGTRRIYNVEIEGLAALREYLDTFWAEALEAFQERADEEATSDEQSEKRGKS